MPRPFDQAKGCGLWVSEMEITTRLIWWQPILMCTFCIQELRIAIESGQVAFPANDLLYNSAIILTPEKLSVATKTIGGCLARAAALEQEQGESFGSPLLVT